MNTGDGFFFGSEIRRLLKRFRAKRGGRFGLCDFCGPSCQYWSTDLYDVLRRAEVNTLPALYQELTARHPEIKFLVDGSKILPSNEEFPDHIIVPTKHPLRLVASHIYNMRECFDIHSEQLEDVGIELEKSIGNDLQPVRRLLRRLAKHYRRILASFPDSFTFRADEAHRGEFQLFRDLERYLGVPPHTFDPDRFSKKPSHTIGGNRAPVWIMKEAHGRPILRTPRRDYYISSVSTGDWKLDHKYLLLIRPAVLERILSMPAYSQLCDLLAYDLIPTADRISGPAPGWQGFRTSNSKE